MIGEITQIRNVSISASDVSMEYRQEAVHVASGWFSVVLRECEHQLGSHWALRELRYGRRHFQFLE